MDKEKAIAYVKYGLNENITPRQVKMTILGANLLYPIGIFCGIAWGNTAMQLGLAILSISVFTILSLLIYQRGVTLKKLLIVYSILGIELAINCILTCFVCSYKLGTSPIIIPFVIAIPLCVFFLYVILTKKSVEEGKFLQGKHVKKGKVGVYWLLGATAGVAGARAILKDAGQDTAAAVLLIGFLALCAIAGYGMGNLLKVHYVNKFALTKADLE